MVKSVRVVHIFCRAIRIARFIKNLSLRHRIARLYHSTFFCKIHLLQQSAALVSRMDTSSSISLATGQVISVSAVRHVDWAPGRCESTGKAHSLIAAMTALIWATRSTSRLSHFPSCHSLAGCYVDRAVQESERGN